MKRSDKDLYRKLLLALRAQRRGEVKLFLNTALDVTVSEPLPTPRGVCRTCRTMWRTSVAGDLREFVDRLIDGKEAMLYHVDNALRRIEEGSCGICTNCKIRISEKWLLTVPYTLLCATCHSQQAAA